MILRLLGRTWGNDQDNSPAAWLNRTFAALGISEAEQRERCKQAAVLAAAAVPDDAVYALARDHALARNEGNHHEH